MTEIWKEAIGFNGNYLVSNLGNVYSNISHKVLKQTTRRHGYKGVWLFGNGGVAGRNGKIYPVHRIVAEAFCEKKPQDTEVNHKNEIKWDNRAENLEWCTHKENTNYGTAIARRVEKTRNNERSKPVYEYDKTTGELKNVYPSVHEIIRQHSNYSLGNICLVIAGQKKSAYGSVWSH